MKYVCTYFEQPLLYEFIPNMKTLLTLSFILLSCIFSTMVWGQSRPLELFPQPQRIVISNEYCNFDQGVMLKGIDNPDKDAVEAGIAIDSICTVISTGGKKDEG